MTTMQLIGIGFSTVLTPIGIALMFVGVAVGIVFGALPGLSATMAIALFLPVTYTMLPTNAMTLLMALFIGAISGGLISAILLNIPGTPVRRRRRWVWALCSASSVPCSPPLCSCSSRRKSRALP